MLSKSNIDTIIEVEKFNPYHDARGRFASADSATSFTYKPGKGKMYDAAIAREKERTGYAPSKELEETPRMKAIHDAEDQIRHQNYETAVVIDKDGNEVIRKDGGQNMVGFTPMECFMLRNNTLTHNHPRSSMFSMEDTLCFARNEMEEMRATNREGVTYSIKRGEGYSRNKGMDFVSDYDSKYKDAVKFAQGDLDKRGFAEKIMSGEITHDQANKEFGRVVTNQMVQWTTAHASDYGVDFSVEKRTVTKSYEPYDTIVYKDDADVEFVLDDKTNRLEDEAFQEWLNGGTVEKFNPYHDAKGRFATSGNFTSFTYSPGKSKAHDLAIERQKERTAGRMPTEAQAKTLKGIESRTRNLKKEQFRVVDREGNVVMQKQGDRNSVSFSIGEARDNFPGNITIHNHPDGGTFSSADLSAIGHGATEIRAASPEGTYILRNARYGGKYNAGKVKTWYDMRDDIDAASEGFKNHRQLKSEIRKPYDEQLKPISDKWAKRKEEGADWDELNKIAAEYTAKADSFKGEIEAAARKAYVDQYHHWYKANAGKYGLEYEFIPTTTRARKSIMDNYDETIEKGSGEIVLDRKMQEDVEEMTAAIIEELKNQFPGVKKSAEADEEITIYKTDDDKRLVFGWASISITVDGEQLEDRQHDMIDPEDLEEAVYEYVLNFRDTGEEHIPTMRKKGKLVESCVFTAEKQRAMGIPEGILPIGWWIGFKIEDDAAWEKVKNGTYKMFSIEGRANRVPVEKADAGRAMAFDEIIEQYK